MSFDHCSIRAASPLWSFGVCVILIFIIIIIVIIIMIQRFLMIEKGPTNFAPVVNYVIRMAMEATVGSEIHRYLSLIPYNFYIF